jgi:hypothetical protein
LFLLVNCVFSVFPSSGKAVCEFPGEPLEGFVVPTKFHYLTGEGISVVCKGNHQPLGPAFIYCTSQGKWSAPLPSCKTPIVDFQEQEHQHEDNIISVETVAKIQEEE